MLLFVLLLETRYAILVFAPKYTTMEHQIFPIGGMRTGE